MRSAWVKPAGLFYAHALQQQRSCFLVTLFNAKQTLNKSTIKIPDFAS